MAKRFSPKKMFKELYRNLEESYDLCYVDYRDEIEPQAIAKCLEKKSTLDLDLSGCFCEMRRSSAVEELETLIRVSGYTESDVTAFRHTQEYDDLLAEIEYRDVSQPVRDTFVQSTCHMRITLHSNYDCWLPLWETRSLYLEDSALKGLLAALCLNPSKIKQEALRQGVACEGRWPNIPSREGKEIVSYEDFIENLIECPNYGLWSFFGTFDMESLWKAGFKTDDMVIPKGTMCYMYNSWNGGGSCAKTRTLREVSLKELTARSAHYLDIPRIHVDERDCDAGYSSDQVYGCHRTNEVALVAA